MSRFAHLELDTPAPPLTEAEEPPLRDEQHYLRVARTCYDTGDFEGALLMYSRVLRYDPNSDEAWSGQVRSLIELGELEEALLWADKGLAKLPDSALLMAAKAVVLARLNRLEEAHEFSDGSLQARDASSYLWAARADVLLSARQKGAHYCLEKAVETAAGDVSLLLQLARTLLTHDNPALALRYLRRAESLAPDNPHLWCLMGQAHHEEGDREAARRHFQRALHLRPGFKPAQAALTELDQEGLLSRLLRRRRKKR